MLLSLLFAALVAFAVAGTTSIVIHLQRQEAQAAKVTIASLENDAAQARLEQERLKEQLAWRVIPSANAVILERILAAHPGSVNLKFTTGDSEAIYLAVQFSRIFEQAHWRVASGALSFTGAVVFGIRLLPGSAGPDGQTLREALSAAGMPFSTEALPPVTMEFAMGNFPNAPTLMIGSKSPPAI